MLVDHLIFICLQGGWWLSASTNVETLTLEEVTIIVLPVAQHCWNAMLLLSILFHMPENRLDDSQSS